MIPEFASLLSSSKAACDIAKNLAAVYIDDKVRNRTAELVSILLSVQSDTLSIQAKQQELIKEKDNLEKTILQYKNWTITEGQYELKEVARGIFVYAKKPGIEPAEPMHWLCTNCWQDKIKAIIQRSSCSDIYTCPRCKTSIDLAEEPPLDMVSGAIVYD